MNRITKRDQLLLALKDAINEAKITDGTEVALADVVQPEGTPDGERIKLLVCGIDMTWDVEGPFKRYQTQGEPKYRFNVGQHGSKTQFPERGDGTFNLNKAALLLVGLARNRMLTQERTQVRDQDVLIRALSNAAEEWQAQGLQIIRLTATYKKPSNRPLYLWRQNNE